MVLNFPKRVSLPYKAWLCSHLVNVLIRLPYLKQQKRLLMHCNSHCACVGVICSPTLNILLVVQNMFLSTVDEARIMDHPLHFSGFTITFTEVVQVWMVHRNAALVER